MDAILSIKRSWSPNDIELLGFPVVSCFDHSWFSAQWWSQRGSAMGARETREWRTKQAVDKGSLGDGRPWPLRVCVCVCVYWGLLGWFFSKSGGVTALWKLWELDHCHAFAFGRCGWEAHVQSAVGSWWEAHVQSTIKLGTIKLGREAHVQSAIKPGWEAHVQSTKCLNQICVIGAPVSIPLSSLPSHWTHVCFVDIKGYEHTTVDSEDIRTWLYTSLWQE